MGTKKVKKGYIDPVVIRRAIKKYGAHSQVQMIQEECLELALAIQKLNRYDGGLRAEKYEAVIDEIADVKIMIAQAEMIFKKDMIDERVDFKINRLKKRLGM